MNRAGEPEIVFTVHCSAWGMWMAFLTTEDTWDFGMSVYRALSHDEQKTDHSRNGKWGLPWNTADNICDCPMIDTGSLDPRSAWPVALQ